MTYKNCDPYLSDFEEEEDYEPFEYDGIPEGCLACGGDYPNCTTSCPLFDDQIRITEKTSKNIHAP